MSWLGTVARDYDDPRLEYHRLGADLHVTRPEHRRDDTNKFMRPNADGELLVAADCGECFMYVPQRHVLDGVAAQCNALTGGACGTKGRL